MSVRARIGLGMIVAAEAYFLWRYASLGTELHYWLHLLHGVAFGLGAWVAVNVVRRRALTVAAQREGALAAGFAGHMYAAVPDIVFLAAGALHVRWMDVFAIHIRIHMVPAALWVSWAFMVLAVAGWVALASGRRWMAGALVATLVVAVTVAVSLAPPIPSTVQEVRTLAAGGLWCPLQLPQPETDPPGDLVTPRS